MDLDKIYNKTMESLQNGTRSGLKLTDSELLGLTTAISKKSLDLTINRKILGIISFCSNFHSDFETYLLFILENIKESELLIFALSATHKHILTRRMINGERVPHVFSEILKNLLSHPDLEVIEWTLRTIDQTGNQMIRLKADVLKIKHFFVFLSKRKKIIRELVLILEKKWSQSV